MNFKTDNSVYFQTNCFRTNKLTRPDHEQEIQEEIKNNYEITFLKDEGLYELTPELSSNRSYENIVFRVDSMDRIKWMKVLYQNNDWTETEFSNWKEFDKVSDYFFKYLKESTPRL